MERVLSRQKFTESVAPTESDKRKDRIRSTFILRNRFRGIIGKKRLGYIWIFLDPIIFSLVYLFVFTVIRARVKPVSLFIGITLYRILSESSKSGLSSIKDHTGGILCERVRTRVLVDSSVKFRFVDILTRSIGTSTIIVLFFDVPLIGAIGFLAIAQVTGFLFEGAMMNLSRTAKRIPDITNVVNHFLMLMFYASPALYGMSELIDYTGSTLHYRINEFNPFSYFVELSRYLAGVESVFLDLDLRIFGFFIGALTLLTYRGYRRIGDDRWEMTSWS